MFWTRLASGIVLVLIALLAMGFGGIPLAAILLVISLIAYRELTKALRCASKPKGLNGLEIVGMAGILCWYGAVFFSGDTQLMLHRTMACGWAAGRPGLRPMRCAPCGLAPGFLSPAAPV